MSESLVNYKINFPRVRLIGSDGEQLGVVSKQEALTRAKQANLDVVVIAEKANPPVAKILDYGKFKYELAKKEKEAARKQRASKIELKELQLRPVTDSNDINRIIRRANEFLIDGDKVKIIMKFKGRELSHKDMGKKVLESVVVGITDGTIENGIQEQDRSYFVLFNPVKKT